MILAVQEYRKPLLGMLTTYVLMLAVLVSAYSPVLTTNYFFYDDYYELTRGKVPFLLILPEYLGGYRPGFAVWLSLVTNSSNTLLDSVWVRFAGVFGLALLCYAFYTWARRRGFDKVAASCLSVFVCTTPAFQSAIGYASAAVSVYCCLLSALSAMVVLEAWTSPRASRLCRGIAIGFGALLVMLAVGTYQPPAMFCWVIVAVSWCAPTLSDWRLFRRACYVFLGTFLLGAGGTFVLSRILLAVLDMRASGRTALLSDPAEIIDKFEWFALSVVPDSFVRVLYGWSEDLLLPRLTSLWVTGGLLLLTLFVPLLRKNEQLSWQSRVLQMTCVPVLLLLAFSPFLLIKEKGYQTLYFTTLQPLVVVLCVCGIGHLWMSAARPLSIPIRKKVGAIGIGVLALVSVLTCNRNMLQVYVVPNSVEYHYVKNLLSHADLSNVSHIHIKGHLNFSYVLNYSELLVSVVINEVKPGYSARITSSSDEIPPVIHDEIMMRNLDLLRPAYTLTPHGYYALRADITEEEKEAVRRYFVSLTEIYREEGALIIDLDRLKDIVSMWRGML